jgi:exosortase H (IPTLxxWG-CTERM-specific)
MRTSSRMVVIFAATMIVGGGVLLSEPVQQAVMTPWSETITAVCAHLMRAAGVPVDAVQHVLVTSDRSFAVSIENECNGAWSHLILLSGILAYPATVRRRVVGGFLAQAALFAINVLRVASLMLLGMYAPALLRPAHVYVWQFLIIGCALMLFRVWADADPLPGRR